MLIKPYLVHALSPLHAGTGQSVDVIDLPIARTRATGIPFLPGSSLKGVLRERCRGAERSAASEAVFGPEHTEADKHAGAFAVTDARLLALPVRSYCGTFAWVSSPLLLALARRDLAAAGWAKASALPQVVPPKGPAACVTAHSRVAHQDGKGSTVYLEDLDLPARAEKAVDAWASWLARWVAPEGDVFTGRLVVVDDDTMSFLLETATQIDARVRIDGETGTVAQGALWYEESLPAETLLVGLAMADRSRSGMEMSPQEVLRHALPGEVAVQLGGKASVGRGRCRVLVVEEVGS